ncbi:hypothetical protein L207DRAFT_16284 [Hyaloscypha variabilis F]|uniref:Uncharacterized protein n=1 Tax=Hyaloscypha variabilis (strain UAMH 11265 / GT02V1 / F) TaxID=1149755 RepID=A0A2J6SDC4_HYAVF|nr:hypothetical protein L207DRAFT_16284 [Hyaloscypha variabilis F]
MFRPSQSLLFRPMPALNKLKIHQPLPLNPRESQQLLNILTTSFRQHLDREHPPWKTNTVAVSSPQSSTTSRRRRKSEPAAHPTDQHLHSLLTNPLFSVLPGVKGNKTSAERMEMFDQAVAKGLMDIQYAYICLAGVKRDIIKSSVLDIRDGMKDCGAGLKVLKWLVSSGMANDNEFLKHNAFGELLMQFLVAEGLQEATWTWIKRALEGRPNIDRLEGPARLEARQDTIRPLMLLLKAETMGPVVSLDNAYICLSRAAGYFKSSSIVDMRPFLGPPGLFLAHRTIFNSHEPPSESSFESFLGLIPVISKDSDYYLAHLNVLHPARPTPDFAMDYLSKHMDSTSELPQGIDGISKVRQSRSRIQFCLDTAKLLLETERFGEAHWVMDLLRTNYPKQLGVKEENRQLEQARAEASSLELLERLSLA